VNKFLLALSIKKIVPFVSSNGRTIIVARVKTKKKCEYIVCGAEAAPTDGGGWRQRLA